MKTVTLHPKALEHLSFWMINDNKIAKRILKIIQDIQRDPFNGIGKPEPLKHDYSGAWSRRITDEHRLVYKVEGQTIHILQCRYHY